MPVIIPVLYIRYLQNINSNNSKRKTETIRKEGRKYIWNNNINLSHEEAAIIYYTEVIIPTYCVYITAAFYGFFLFKRNTSSSYLHVSMRRIDILNQSETYCCISALLSYCKHFPYGQDTVRWCNYASTTSIAR